MGGDVFEVAGIGIFVAKPDRLAEVGDGAVVVLLGKVQVAPRAETEVDLRKNRDRLAVARDGAVEVAILALRDGAMVIGQEQQSGIVDSRALDRVEHATFVIAFAVIGSVSNIERKAHLGIESERLAVILVCLFVVAPLLIRGTAIEVRRGIRRVEEDRRGIVGSRSTAGPLAMV